MSEIVSSALSPDNFWTFFGRFFEKFGHFVDIPCFWVVQRFARYKPGPGGFGRKFLEGDLVFGEGVKSARGATAILAAATTLETCLEHPIHTSCCKRTIVARDTTELKNAIVVRPSEIIA